jgi:hypothetical protein
MPNYCEKCNKEYCIKHSKVLLSSLVISDVEEVVKKNYHTQLFDYMTVKIKTLEENIPPCSPIKRMKHTYSNGCVSQPLECKKEYGDTNKTIIGSVISHSKAKGFTFNTEDSVHIKYDEIDKSFGTISTMSSNAAILANLLKSITKDIVSDKMKAHALFKWITLNISYDTESVDKGLYSHKQNPIDVVNNKKGVCSGFSNLYKQLCIESDVECKVISGITKKVLEGSPGHAWNAVRFDDKWHLVDTTWDDFDIDPVIFIKTRFPDARYSQFLDTPITRDEFLYN